MLAIRRRSSAFGALLAVSLLVTAQTAHALPATLPALTGHDQGAQPGTASATTASMGLDVALLNGTVDVPVDVSLNAIHAPGSSDGSALQATVQGVTGGGKPLTLLQATLGHSAASVDRKGARAEVDLVGAKLHLPGLLLRDLVDIKEISASADCPAVGRPSAEVNVLGTLSVLGKGVVLSAEGPSRVSVPGVGTVDLELSKKTLTSTTAAATALQLDVTVNPLQLNVAKVTGRVELAAVRCAKGSGDGGQGSGGASSGPTIASTPAPSGSSTSVAAPPPPPVASSSAVGGPASAQPTEQAGAVPPTEAPATSNLAETGGGSSAPLYGGVALLLVGAGAGAVALTRRRRRTT